MRSLITGNEITPIMLSPGKMREATVESDLTSGLRTPTASRFGETSYKTHIEGTGKIHVDQITDGTRELVLLMVGICHCGYEENCADISEMHIEEIRDKRSACLNLLQNVTAEK